MKIGIIFFLMLTVGPLLTAHPTTKSVVSRPQTAATATAPKTNSVVTRPQTTSVVTRPTTFGSAAPAPTAPAAATTKKTATGGSYTPSYKQAKTFNSSSKPKEEKSATPALPPEVQNAMNSLGMSGGADAAEKANAAANFDMSKGMTEEQAQKLGLPKGFMGQLKQRSHEEAKTKGKK